MKNTICLIFVLFLCNISFGQKDDTYLQKQKEIVSIIDFYCSKGYPNMTLDKAVLEYDLAHIYTKEEVLSIDASKLKTCFEHILSQTDKMSRQWELYKPFSEAIRASKNDEEFSENLRRLKAFEEKHGKQERIPAINWNTMEGQSCQQWQDLTLTVMAREAKKKKQD